jgi:glycosyltransferase involved in cell wall biosynthesis
MRPMKVLHLIPNLKREGAQVLLFNLITCGVARRTQCVVCAWREGGALHGALKEHAVPTFVPARSRRFSTPRRTLGFIDHVVASNDIDLIHAHMPDAAVWGWLAAKRRGLPLVITYHSHEHFSRSNPVWSTVRFLGLPLAARYARRNIAISTSVGERVRRSLALGPECVSIVRNGVPIPPAHGETVRRGRKAAGPCIIAVGRLVELKGHDQLVAAAATLVEQHHDARFLLVGSGPLEERLRQQAESLRVSEHVFLTGQTDDVPAYLRKADVYVTMSRYEGVPLATLEAMAWGVPVVASDVPGHRDLIQHGVNGLLYPPGDVSALARAIGEVLDEPERARERAIRARQLIKDSYNVDVAASSYERLYAEILGQEKDGRGRAG